MEDEQTVVMTGGRLRGVLAVCAALMSFAVPVAAAAPPPPPPHSSGSSAVALHVDRVRERLANPTAQDETARRAVAEARVSCADAERALRRGRVASADQLAASADELLRVADPRAPEPPGPPPDPEVSLQDVDTIGTALADVGLSRVRDLLAFARATAGVARREAASDDPEAGLAALRAEAIARAAAHVAIAGDPGLDRVLPHPPPPAPPAAPAAP